MTKKLSKRAELVLGYICGCTHRDGAGELTQYMVPSVYPYYGTIYGEKLPEYGFRISDGSDAAIIRSFAASGLVEMKPNTGRYSCAATALGVAKYEEIAERKRAARNAS